MDYLQIDLEVPNVLHYARIVTETVGEKWVVRKVKEAKSRRKKYGRIIKKDKKYHNLHQFKQLKVHPLIEWVIEFENWKEECIKTRRFVMNDSILKFSTLGFSLEKAKKQEGFNKVIKRLKMEKEFFSSSFEVEVAAIYLSKGYNVEFIEEGGERSPDLKVAIGKNDCFWVECKCRDILTERDKKIRNIWAEFESALIRKLEPEKINVSVMVKSRRDPVREEIEGLITYVLKYIEDVCVGSYNELCSTLNFSENYQIVVKFLSRPDEVVGLPTLAFSSSDELDFVNQYCEIKESSVEEITEGIKTGETFNSVCRNPIIIGVKNIMQSDNVSGIVHGLKSAVGQLPKEGPGVVWIRVPDDSWNDEKTFSEAERILKSELTGSFNRRVNAVFLLTRTIENLERGADSGRGYRPLILNIEHDNPRSEVEIKGVGD